MDYTEQYIGLSVDLAFMEFINRCKKKNVIETMLEDLFAFEGEKELEWVKPVPFQTIGESLEEKMSRLYFTGKRVDGEHADIQIRFVNSLEDAGRANLCLHDLMWEREQGKSENAALILINIVRFPDFTLSDENSYRMTTYFNRHDPHLPLSKNFELVTISLPQFQKQFRKKEVDIQVKNDAKWLLLMTAVQSQSGKPIPSAIRKLEEISPHFPLFKSAMDHWKSLVLDGKLKVMTEERYKKIEYLRRFEAAKRKHLKTKLTQLVKAQS